MQKNIALDMFLENKENPRTRTYSFPKKVMTVFLHRLLAIDSINSLYREIPSCRDPFSFAMESLKTLDIEYMIAGGNLNEIPKSGPAVVVANHPFGGIDGLILIDMLAKVRTDFRILANYFLNAVPDLEPVFFSVDPFGRKTSVQKNAMTVKKILEWVRNGGMLAVFPSGEVSHLTWKRRRVEDPEWNDSAVRLIRLTGAPVVPVFFDGRNSNLFQAAGLIRPLLRTAMLPRELLKKRSSTVSLRIGNVIPNRRLHDFDNTAEFREYLKFRTYLLGRGFQEKEKLVKLPIKPRGRPAGMKPAFSRQDPALLKKEVDCLPREQLLIEHNQLAVYQARSEQIPRLLLEIGGLRERTFRSVGEGTGNPVDLDRFDNYYKHLFLWNREKDEVAGAYRLGATDEILAGHGKKGLYTHTLFKYNDRLLNKIGPALELGRSFVLTEYQKNYSSLLLLWKGIGRYVAVHPRYRILFGAVSISNDYHFYSRQLIVGFLKMHSPLPDLKRMVRPRKPFRDGPIPPGLKWIDADEDGLEELSSWITGVEPDGKGIPVLLKQYLKLGGKVASFNVDRKFGNTLDGLIFVDLTRAKPTALKRYMGEAGFHSFMANHREDGLPDTAPCLSLGWN